MWCEEEIALYKLTLFPTEVSLQRERGKIKKNRRGRVCLVFLLFTLERNNLVIDEVDRKTIVS